MRHGKGLRLDAGLRQIGTNRRDRRRLPETTVTPGR